jgi:hypothetical protein
MSSGTVTGTIKEIFDTQIFESGFQKREFVVTTDDEYPQDLKFEMIKDKVTILDKFQEGSRVEVSYNLRGNEYNGKYYVNLQAWKVYSTEGAKQETNTPKKEVKQDSLGDLPF